MSRNNDRRNARRQNNGGWQRASSTNKVAAKATTMTGGEDPTHLTAVESFLDLYESLYESNSQLVASMEAPPVAEPAAPSRELNEYGDVGAR